MRGKPVFGLFFALAVLSLLLAGCSSTSDVVDESGKKMGEARTKVSADGSVETSVNIETVEKGGQGEPCEWDGQCDSSDDDVVACVDGHCTSVDCKYSKHCDDEHPVCVTHTCITVDELESRFETWSPSSMAPCPECEHCHGALRGTVADKFGNDYRICRECTGPEDCKDGYKCEIGMCVPA